MSEAKKRKQYDELDFTDDFMFCKILQSDKNLCKELTELILSRKIGEILQVDSQKPIEITADGKGVRFDVYMEDDESTVYDIEMQTTTYEDLPKRMRYYQSVIDIHVLHRLTRRILFAEPHRIDFFDFLTIFAGIRLGFRKNGNVTVIRNHGIYDYDDIFPESCDGNDLHHRIIVVIIPAKNTVLHPLKAYVKRIDHRETPVREPPSHHSVHPRGSVFGGTRLCSGAEYDDFSALLFEFFPGFPHTFGHQHRCVVQ